MIFDELLADIKQGKFLENLNDEKILFLSWIKYATKEPSSDWSWVRGNNETPRISRNQLVELIYTLEVFYVNKEKELHEIYRKLNELEIDFYRHHYEEIPNSEDVLSVLHFAIDRPVNPETDKKVLKKIISEMRKRKQNSLFNMTIESKKHTATNRYLNVSPNPALMRCSIMDLAIVNNHWPAVEVLLEEGFNAGQIMRLVYSTDPKTAPTYQIEGMPRLHFAYQLGTTDMFAKLVASAKIDINFRCKTIADKYISAPTFTRNDHSDYQGYGESILLDALDYSHSLIFMDKITILLESPTVDLTQRTMANRGFSSEFIDVSCRTALDIVLREGPKQNIKLVALVKETIMKKMIERFKAVHEQLTDFQWDSGPVQNYFLPHMNELVAQYEMLTPEDLASTHIGQQTVREFKVMTFKFKDARQQGTWEVQNQLQDEQKEEQKERTEPKEEKYPKPK